jgi:pimeloyl-ACP methyl ester carboxylesterase
VDIFIGGGGDDLGWLGLGVVRAYEARYARETGRPTLYFPNGRIGRVKRAIVAAGRRFESVNVIGHSWGAVDAYLASLLAHRQGVRVANLITLDPVSGPWRRSPAWSGGAFWLNVTLASASPDRSDRLTELSPFARKPSRLPISAANQIATLDLNHWDVGGMMTMSGARARLDELATLAG